MNALVGQWRELAAQCGSDIEAGRTLSPYPIEGAHYLQGRAFAFDRCADELDAALRACAEAPETPADGEDYEQPQRTLDIIARMLGWMNTPPRRIFEQEINTLKSRACAEARPSIEKENDYDVCACGHYRSTHGHGGKICDGWMPGGTGHHEAQCLCAGFHLSWPAAPLSSPPRAEALAPHPHNGEVQVTEEDTRGGTMEIPEGRRTASQDGVLSASAPNRNSRPIVFEIEAPQAEMLRTFLGAHQCRPINRAAIGASPIEIVFTQLSIAMHCEARCTICKEKVDLNDYDSW